MIWRALLIGMGLLNQMGQLSAQTSAFYFGADLSYVNEMEDCGAVYTQDGDTVDVYALMSAYGCNLIRLRLWHTPDWYDPLNAGFRFSDLEDVRMSIQRARAKDIPVLLDFHLSDTWAAPGHQVVPAAWAAVVDDLPVLQDSLYQYMYSTLLQLGHVGLLPEMVQIGNETNRGILLSQEVNDAGWTLDWSRNSALFNTAIVAVRAIEDYFQTSIQIALHIANPAEAVWYYEQFQAHGVTDFDIIGLSYYWPWHNHTISAVGGFIAGFRAAYPDKDVMLLETATPWTMSFADNAGNNLNSVPPGYSPASPANQKKWLTDLTQVVIDEGGIGVVYWEPAWVSTGCFTQWAQGSHWENCTFFDFENVLIEEGGIGWMREAYDFPSGVKTVRPDDQCYGIRVDGGGIRISRQMERVRDEQVGIQLWSMDGVLRWRERFFLGPDDIEINIGVKNTVMGAYIIRVAGEEGCVSTKLIVNRK